MVLLLLAACTDNLGDDGTLSPPIDNNETGEVGTATPRYLPSVCSSLTWTTKLADSGPMKVSVSKRPNGAVALVAPTKGGPLSGFTLDTRAQTLTGSKVEIDETVSEVATSYMGNRVVAVASYYDSVFVSLLDNDFTNPERTAKVPGRVLPEGAFFPMQGDLVMPVGADDGVWLYRFDDSFEPYGGTQLRATEPVRSIAAAQMGDATMTAWSTDNACYMAMTSTFGPGISTRTPTACPDPRLAINPSTKQGVMVFDTPDGAQLMGLKTTQLGNTTRTLREATHAPRVVFDGTRFWISYIDLRGDVLVGILDGNGNPTTLALEGVQPAATAHELVMVDGAPWVFALTSDGFTAHQMCVDTVW